jgi:hypothetical protein
LDSASLSDPYNQISEPYRILCDKIKKNSNPNISGIYQQLLLLSLMQQSEQKLISSNFPDHIKNLFVQNFLIIMESIQNKDPELFDIGQAHFCKSLSLCNLRLIPVGGRKIHLSGIPKKIFLKKALVFLTALKGFSPYYESHLDSKDKALMLEFTPEGFIKTYKSIAELLLLNPHVKGVFGTSWFYDPALETISPHLSYLRKNILDHGGILISRGSNEHAIHNATLTSNTRKKLFESKKYVPTNFMAIWPRQKLISWAEMN